MTRKLFIVLAGAALSGQAHAICEIDIGSEPGGSPPSTMTAPSLTITIDADAPADTSKFIAEANTAVQGVKVTYHHCEIGNPYGKNVTAMLGADLGNGLFATNIDGIAIKPRWNNGEAFGNFNSQREMEFGTDIGRWTYPPNSFFRIELYKTKETLSLTNPAGEQVLPSGTLAYNWVNTNSLTNYAQKLDIGRITIISTPSCTFAGKKVVDFGLVTSGKLNQGIERNLDFDITCKTDYGKYSATASITTQTPTADGNYIKVKDNNGQDDRMRIKISDSTGKLLKLNGSSSEQKVNIASAIPAEFNWKATLEPTSVSAKPANGIFSAAAEIILQIN
ncbi:fimbrial protein [Yersinia mollaretii]|uniref:fimbrial protein n=1 Tax=Yersinia mollaretii TaxID=33060 RepID=UPI0005E383C7|nr:fimbrial protein [Yersinia mollaretii]MDA5527689.1 fimbrial protein [Yersinia mollaretii]MDR7873850.1 fimbrial protein [Yersinia mollaretii]PHZ31171.1 fimbrial protein [Yersinia mollaretii]WQC74282.1 fimbrial protein [Yersinia mollaretii]CNF17241.1 putative fimbrial protein [Yersinia mollaretii]